MKQLLVFLFLLCAASVSAQDVIVKKDGSTVVCRVVELTDTEITYKKWGDLNGSNYVMDRSLASAINYENGKKVNLSEVENLYQPGNQNDGVQQYNDRALLNIDYASHNPLKKVKTLRTIGWIGGGVLVACGIVLIALDDGDKFADLDKGPVEHDERNYGLGFVGLGAVWTTSFLLAAHHQRKKAENLLNSTSLYQQDFKLNNGSSFSAGIDLLTDRTEAGRTFGNNTLGLGLRYNF